MNLSQPTVPVAGPNSLGLSTQNLSMYSSQQINVPTECEMEEIYSKSHMLGRDDNVPNIRGLKRENIFQSVFGTLINTLGEYLLKASVSFTSNMNNSLSVTVVPNENVISEDFFKSLTENRESLAIENLHSHTVQNKESLLDSIYNATVSSIKSPIVNGNTNRYITSKGNVDVDASDSPFKLEQKLITCDEKLNRRISFDTYTSKSSGLRMNDYALTMRDSYVMGNNQNIDCMSTKKTYIREKETEDILTKDEIMYVVNMFRDREAPRNECSDFSAKINSELLHSSLKTMRTLNTLEEIAPQEEVVSHQTVLSHLFTNMWPKIVGSVSDCVCVQTKLPKIEMPEKRPHSPKLRSKLNMVARGCGRGRAKSQLRRSGVSQSRHRREQIRRKLIADIQEDLDTWETFEGCYTLQCDDLSNISNFESSLENQLDEDDVPVEQCHSMGTSMADVTLRKQKQNTNEVIEPKLNELPTRVNYVPEVSVDIDVFLQDEYEDEDECEYEYESENATSQSRSLSESSADSEDSYCIVFDNGTESDYESDYEETSDEEEEDHHANDSVTPQKVKFNLKPTIHTMVHWNYAYRAARKGPWERMARDRERFKRRICCIEQVLDPILTTEHRNRIWQERFTV